MENSGPILTEAKRLSLKMEVLRMAKEGKNWRQIERMALKKYGVKLTK